MSIETKHESHASSSLDNHHQQVAATLAVEVTTEGDVRLEDCNDEEGEDRVATKHESSDEDEITESSDLSDLSRRIWIVTTAALPWMTGTAVNPLLRALSLAEHREENYVTLLIPWLESMEARQTLYGKLHTLCTSPADQEAWIRKYCVERCSCSENVAYKKLRILFWKGIYQESMGSIFPKEDICSTIPRDEADICILEEPEHLNWFRVPARPKRNQGKQSGSASSSSIGDSEKEQENNEVRETKKDIVGASEVEEFKDSDSDDDGDVNDDDIEILGWSHKFRHVVGILHTNYADYIRQYGMASMVTAPALNSLSSMVVKAYCHRIIRLSATLPTLDSTKEVTCNVHGVRHEFFEQPTAKKQPEVPEVEGEGADDSTQGLDGREDAKATGTMTPSTSNKTEGAKHDLAPVYFIGKLIWAKGFENVLEVQEKFKAATGEYFAMDVYGGGKDEKDIQRAFFGRLGSAASRASSGVSQDSDSSSVVATKEVDQKAAAVFGLSSSLRDQFCGGDNTVVDVDDYVLVVNTEHDVEEDAASYTSKSTPGNVTPPGAPTNVAELLATPNVEDSFEAVGVVEMPVGETKSTDQVAGGASSGGPPVPLEVLGDLSEKTVSTTVETADAALKLIESIMNAGFGVALGGAKIGMKKGDGGDSPASSMKNPLPFNIASAKTRFKVCYFIALLCLYLQMKFSQVVVYPLGLIIILKWRRNPIPANFLGVQDHIVVRDILEHKVRGRINFSGWLHSLSVLRSPSCFLFLRRYF